MIRKISFYTIIIILIAINSSFSQSSLLPVGEGFIKVEGGNVWYKVTGTGKSIPLILLHGGPGIPSYYFKPIDDLGSKRQIITYDRLGCGRSDRITDTTLMTVDHYVEELKQLVDQLGLNEFYLLGHSWGAILGTEYYLKYPAGVKALILSSPSISTPLWEIDADILIASLPDSVQTAIRNNEKNKTYDDPEYQQAIQIYYEHFLARKLPWSAEMEIGHEQMAENIYMYMSGPSEFTITGTLKNYDITNRLGEIKIPVLFMCGEFDEARPSTVKYFTSLVTGAKFKMIKGSAHLTMHDKPKESNQAVIDFLNNLEKK